MMNFLSLLLILLISWIEAAHAENVYCTYYRDSNEITCGTVTCETHVPIGAESKVEEEVFDLKLARGWYRIGTVDSVDWKAKISESPNSADNQTGPCLVQPLSVRRASGLGYWDFYTQIPERNCVGHFGLHAGENIAGSVTVKDKRCFDRLVVQIERKSTSEKFDVFQCRKCIFNSCWLGSRILHDQRTYLTNLRSY